MVPPGGSATLYGVLYQLLASLHHVVKLLRVQRRGKDGPVVAAKVIVEPPEGGGDIRIELPGRRIVEQRKARTSGRSWGLQEIVEKVLPDLYLDPNLNLPDDRTSYVFATEGSAEREAQAFFQRLRELELKDDPFEDLNEEDREAFLRMAVAVRKRRAVAKEPEAVTHQKLRRLLGRFEIQENQNAGQLVREINQRLLALVDHVDDIPTTQGHLCNMILHRGTGQGDRNEFMPEDLLREAGLHGVSLENEEELRRTAHEVLKREVARRKYDPDKDVRKVPVWPADKPVLFLSGESGQGKTWQTARLALDEEEGNRLVVVVDSRGNAERDLQRASDLLWKEAWKHDLPISLDRLVERWHQVRGDAGKPWLTICVENVQSLAEARALLRDYDWERWGVGLVLTGPPQIGTALAEENPDRVHYVRLRDFTPAELREYLRRHGRSWETVPADVRDTLKRPLLAGIYTSLGSDPDWAPTREYELYERSWQKIERDLSQYPEDLHLLKKLALKLLDPEPSYPWTWDGLREAGVDPATRDRLERAGWWTRSDEGVEVWHNRMLSWAVAEALADRALSENPADRLLVHPKPYGTRIRRILGYVPMDLLWLLSGDPAKSHLIPDVLISLEREERPFRSLWLYRTNLPTLGRRIIPGLIERQRRLPDKSRESDVSTFVEALSKILDRDPAGRAELPPLLEDASRVVHRVAVSTLARYPHVAAIGPLWSLLRDSSLKMERSNRKEGVSAYRSAFSALRACLELDPGWLHAKVQEIQPEEEPVWELAYLLANIKHPTARSIWLDVKSALFEKIRPGKLHSLMVCIRVFRDREEVSRLEAWLPVEEKWTDNNAFEGIARIDPDRAVFLLETVPLSHLLASHGAWLPILLLNRPDDTRNAVRRRMRSAGEDFWRVAQWYWWYQEWMDRETVEALLDRLAIEVTEAANGTKEAWNRLRLPLQQLSRIHRIDLLGPFEARAGTNLDRGLGDLGAASLDGSHHLDLEKLHAVLLKIGGEGLRSLIRAGLASSDPDHRSEAMTWGLICPEEIPAIDDPEEWVLAAVGEDRALIKKIMAWEEKIENEDLQTLWRLRRWKPPMSDADLAPALEALGSADPRQQVRAMAAISISGREDLLLQLPKWLEGLENVGQEDLEDLDTRASHLVHRLAEGNPDGVQRLACSLDIPSFPWTAVQLLYEGASAELAERIEAHLLEQWKADGRLHQTESDLALHLAQFRPLSDPLLQAVWERGKSSLQMEVHERFFPAVARVDSEEVREAIWKEAFEARYTDPRLNAIRALHSLDPEEAIRAARRGLEDPDSSDREPFVPLLLEIGGAEAVPLLIEQGLRERKTEVLWDIARILRRGGSEVQRELRMRLESPEFRVRRVAAHLAGWQGPGFLEADLRRLAEEDLDTGVQWECLQALVRQSRDRCVLELMDAFRRAEGPIRWSYLESILELGDPRLLVTEEDPLWLGRILTEELGILEVHANWRLKQRFNGVKRSAEQRDRDSED